MCHSRGLNNKINNLSETSIKNSLSRQKIFVEAWQVCINLHKTLQYLATEIFKVKKSLFLMKSNNLRRGNHLARRNIRTTHYGNETISNLGVKIWNLLPEEIKNASSLSVFKTKIKKWIPKKCPFKLCQIYIKNIGFIWFYPIDLQNFVIILLLQFILSLKSYEIKILIFKIGFTILV